MNSVSAVGNKVSTASKYNLQVHSVSTLNWYIQKVKSLCTVRNYSQYLHFIYAIGYEVI